MNQYFPKPYEPFGGDINVKVHLSSYATRTDIKNISHVDTSGFALKSNFASLKAEVDKLDIDKLVYVPVDLSKLSDVVKNDVTKTVYDKLVAKVNNIDTSPFALKTRYYTDKSKTEKEAKISNISGFVTFAALTTVENKVPNFNSLVKKTDYDTKY